MTVTLDIPQEIEVQLSAEAQARGIPLAELLRDVLIEHYEEEEDRRIAESRLNDPQPSISSRQLREKLGLDS